VTPLLSLSSRSQSGQEVGIGSPFRKYILKAVAMAYLILLLTLSLGTWAVLRAFDDRGSLPDSEPPSEDS
jgi:hypothetical protein